MKGGTSFSTLFKQFHTALTRHYANGGISLYDPSKMESFCEEHSPRIFQDIYEAIFKHSAHYFRLVEKVLVSSFCSLKLSSSDLMHGWPGD